MTIDRPPMWQTSTPFLEFYVNGVDILRSSDGKPRTLISFTHNNMLNGNGNWQLEVFDPSYVAIEELLFVTAGEAGSLETATESYGAADSDQKNKDILTHPVMFRYGYISQDGKEIAQPPSGGEFFVGSLAGYVPTFQTNGTHLLIQGQVLGASSLKNRRINTAFYDKDLNTIVQDVCRRMDWTLIPLGEPPGVELLPEGKQPEPLLVPSANIETTEEQPVTFRTKENEDPYDFIKRLLNQARPKEGKLGPYMCRLEYRSEGKFDGETAATPIKPKGYLYYGPMDALAPPVRNYIYLRDPHSDVISFSPSISVATVAVTIGGSLLAKSDDKRLGEQVAHEYTEVDRYVKYFSERRGKLTFSLADMGAIQEGEPESPEDADRIEMANTSSNVPATAKKRSTEEPGNEMSVHVTDRYLSDRQTMDFFLRANLFVNSASLEIHGDPSVDLIPPVNIAVYLFVPTPEDKLRVHWVSSIWIVVGAVHSIMMGAYTTTLQLTKTGMQEGGVTSKAAYNSLIETLDDGALKKLGG